jgi:hypothetical protein
MSVQLVDEFKNNIKNLFNSKQDWIYKEQKKTLVFIKKYRELDRFEITYNNVKNRLELCAPLNKSGLNYYCIINDNVIKNNVKQSMEDIVKSYLENYESARD